MAKVVRKSKPCKGQELKIVNFNAAGIDISTREMQVCVPSDRSAESNRVFGTFTKDLHSIALWLKECRIDTVAMESTGVYWLPLFQVLKNAGFEVLLVDPYQVKNYSNRKTDEADAEWLMLLHSYGLLKSCFQPDNVIRQIRNLTRQRAEKLSNLADPKCKSSHSDIVASLQATWSEDHLFVMRQSHELYLTYQSKIVECEQQIERLLKQCTAQVDEVRLKQMRSKKEKAYHNNVSFDVEKYAIGMWGVNVMNIPGLNKNALLRLTAELGYDFVEKFGDARHFTSWANLVPNNKISGGKLLSSKVPKRKNPVGIIFRQCANSLWKANNPIGDYFRHTKARSGHLQAMVVAGKKLATIFFTMVQKHREYDASIYAHDRAYQVERQLAYTRRKLIRLEREKANCQTIEQTDN